MRGRRARALLRWPTEQSLDPSLELHESPPLEPESHESPLELSLDEHESPLEDESLPESHESPESDAPVSVVSPLQSSEDESSS